MSVLSPSRVRSPAEILRVPAILFTITAAGLAAALYGDGWWHYLSWVLLAIPLVVIAFALWRKS